MFPPFKIAGLVIPSTARRVRSNYCICAERKHALTSRFASADIHQSVDPEHRDRPCRELSRPGHH